MAMQNIAKVALLREALRNGPCTSAELNALTGVRIALIGALLGRDIRRGTVVRGTMNKHRVYGLAGSIEPQFLKRKNSVSTPLPPPRPGRTFPASPVTPPSLSAGNSLSRRIASGCLPHQWPGLMKTGTGAKFAPRSVPTQCAGCDMAMVSSCEYLENGAKRIYRLNDGSQVKNARPCRVNPDLSSTMRAAIASIKRLPSRQ